MRHSHLIALAVLTVFSSSCSWYRNLERSLVDDEEKQKRGKVVPREQYDQLLVKYEELSKKYELLKEGKQETSIVDDLQRTQSENFARPSSNVETETVDVFAAAETQPSQARPSAPKELEAQLNLYRRGLSLRSSNPGETTKIFQQLENTAAPAIKVRAKLHIGEMLLARQQYDLALQVFEDIINNQAHSGVVLDALKYAILSSEKLGIQTKKEQYASMLNDVFEVQ